MNKERFTELLNQYLDDEISSRDLSDLMEETRRDSERQKMFLDYCRIHKACSLLGDSFETRRSKRSFKQVAYAVGGLAAAFALLGMAGRNLLPMLNSPTSPPSIVQSGPSGGSAPFFPEIASSEVATPRFFKVNEQPRSEYVGVSNFGNLKSEDMGNWNDRLVLNPSKDQYGLNAENLFSEELLDLGALELQDPFNAFDERNAVPLSLSKATFSSGTSFEITTARDSRSNLK
jgi:hypothetical protein